MFHWRTGVALTGLALAASMAGGSARADGSPGGNWLAWPTDSERDAALASIPRRDGQLLRAVMRCGVEDSGALEDCQVTGETPSQSGLGAALLSLSSKYQRKPPGDEGQREVDIVEYISSIDVPPDWRKRPSAQDLIAVFPGEAYRKGQSGRAVISCVVTEQGALKDCVVVDESPPGAGFGKAAIALTPQFMMRPAKKGDVAVESTARIPVEFRSYGPVTANLKKVLPPNVAWAEAPSFNDVLEAYPKRARTERVGGQATVACSMNRAGRLVDCRAVTASPRGYGFEAAAKKLAGTFVLTVTTAADKKATDDVVVHLPFAFDPAMLDAPQVVGKPSWSALPAGDELRAAFSGLSVTGTTRTTLNCVVQPGGSLSDCAVASEEPADAGVGVAALTLAPSFRLSTWTTEGLPVVGGRVTIPLRYEPPDPAAPEPTPE